MPLLTERHSLKMAIVSADIMMNFALLAHLPFSSEKGIFKLCYITHGKANLFSQDQSDK